MLDAPVRRIIDPPLALIAARVCRVGVRADGVTLTGFALGVAAMAAIATGHTVAGLVGLLLNRFADGLDGAVARCSEPTDRGGFLDIVLDFIVYSGFVFAFALADPDRNALAAAFLIFSFMGTGASFLGFAVMAAKRGLSTEVQGRKSLYYLGGITEGTETIGFFIAFCLFPAAFAPLAWIFGMLCWITTGSRLLLGWQVFRGVR